MQREEVKKVLAFVQNKKTDKAIAALLDSSFEVLSGGNTYPGLTRQEMQSIVNYADMLDAAKRESLRKFADVIDEGISLMLSGHVRDLNLP